MSGRAVCAALGMPPAGPSFLGTDSLSNALVAGNRGSTARSRHFARHYTMMLQRAANGEVRVAHIPDEESPSDFLTKWVSRRKLARSIEYATNERAYVPAVQ